MKAILTDQSISGENENVIKTTTEEGNFFLYKRFMLSDSLVSPLTSDYD